MYRLLMVQNTKIYRRYVNCSPYPAMFVDQISLQLLVFVTHNLVPRSNKEGWSLLRCLRCFTILDLYLAFEAHTEQTITTGQGVLETFVLLMRVCIPLIMSLLRILVSADGITLQKYIKLSTNALISQGESPKKWSFPKMHALVHAFDDIKAKGASRNYNTKPNEKLYRPLKKAYLTQTNFKNIAPQVCFLLI